MVLDTDVLIALEKSDAQAYTWFNTLPESPYVAGFAALELLAGCENAADKRRIERMLRPFVFLWPGEPALEQSVQDFGAIRLRHGPSVLDMLIAVTALDHAQELATFNRRHFAGVPGLITVQPYAR
jgi:predicted nucleic acid-binding protein